MVIASQLMYIHNAITYRWTKLTGTCFIGKTLAKENPLTRKKRRRTIKDKDFLFLLSLFWFCSFSCSAACPPSAPAGWKTSAGYMSGWGWSCMCDPCIASFVQQTTSKIDGHRRFVECAEIKKATTHNVHVLISTYVLMSFSSPTLLLLFFVSFFLPFYILRQNLDWVTRWMMML